MVLILTIFLSLFSIEKSSAVLGEFNQRDYYGPRFPEHTRDSLGNEISWDDSFEQRFFDNLIDRELFQTQDYLIEKLVPSVLCSNFELKKYSSSIRFSFRLISLSLLSEAYLNKCPARDQLYQNCQPETQDMKNYLKAVNLSYGSNLWDKSKNCINCEVNYSCKELTKKINLICSEKDNLYGMSSNPAGFYLVKESNVLEKLSEFNNYGCVKKFSLTNKYKEFADKKFMAAVLAIYEHHNKAYPFGRGVTALNLNSYNDLGIDVLEKKMIIKNEKKIPIKKKVEVSQKIISPKRDQQTKSPKKKLPVIVKKMAPWHSTFFQASESLDKLGLSRVSVNMEKFYFDYIFSTQKIALLTSKLKEFSSLATLKIMKSQDKLGSIEAPIPLVFLKFLIDTDNHQGLYNLIQVIGDQFVVLNDIDQQKAYKKVLVELKMDDKGSFDWYLNILSIKE